MVPFGSTRDCLQVKWEGLEKFCKKGPFSVSCVVWKRVTVGVGHFGLQKKRRLKTFQVDLKRSRQPNRHCQTKKSRKHFNRNLWNVWIGAVSPIARPS